MKGKTKDLLIKKNSCIRDALERIDKGLRGITVVIDESDKLIGTITDGDIRRALLKGYKLEDPINDIIHYNPIYVTKNMSRDTIKDIFIKKAVKEIPVVDKVNKVVDLISMREILIPDGKKNPVIIMAGGLGTRLKDLTKEIPKPMLTIGNHPILHHIINNFKQYGYNNLLISVNHKAEIIKNYFQDGFFHGVKIDYIREDKRLGTAGGIKLAEEYLNESFFVINGDIFTNLNVEAMMKFHKKNEFDITVGVRKHSLQIPYGVIKIKDYHIKKINEKPIIDYMINAGVYCLNPNLIKYIPKDTYFEITELINICIEKGLKIGSYEIKDYWMDIGQINDYKQANNDYENLFRSEACAVKE